MDETILELLKVIEDKGIAIKELSKQLTGYSIVTRVLLDINSNPVSGQTASVGEYFDSYEIEIDKLVRIDLLGLNLNQ